MTSHTHGKPHVERLRNLCLIFACATPIQGDTRKCPSYCVRRLWQLHPQCPQPPRVQGWPRTNWTGIPFCFTPQRCDSFRKFSPSCTPNISLHYHPPTSHSFSISPVEPVGVENVERNEETFNAWFFSEYIYFLMKVWQVPPT